MSTETSTSLRLSRVIKADRERVFAAWTEPEHMNKWAAPEGVDATAEVDLSIGGRYRIHMRDPDGKHFNAVGIYKTIDRPKKLLYTWRWEEPEHDVGETLVTVEFIDLGGSTEVVITHEGFPNAEAKEAHEQGWESCVTRFARMFD